METKTKKIIFSVVLIAVVGVAVSLFVKNSSYTSSTENSNLAVVPKQEKPAPKPENKLVFLPKNSDFKITQIFSKNNTALMVSSGQAALVELGSGKILSSVTAADFSGITFYSAAMVDGDFFITGDQEILRISQDGKLVNTYSTKNGLVNNYNLTFFVDPFEAHTLWVGTFDGLSKLNTQTNKFVNYKSEIGLNSQAYQVTRVRLTQDAVWVDVIANSLSRGGVARLDRKTNSWKAYGPEAFNLMDRVDFDGLVANNSYVAALVRYKLYVYDFKSDSWQLKFILPNKEDGYFGYGTWLSNNYLYLIKIESNPQKSQTNLVALDLSQQDPVYKTVVENFEGNNFSGISYDENLGLWFNDQKFIYPLINDVQGQPIALPNITKLNSFIGSTDSGVYFTAKDALSRYDLASGKIISWNDSSSEYSSGFNSALVETGNYATVIQEVVGGYGGDSGVMRFLRLNFNDPEDSQKFYVPVDYLEGAYQAGIAADGQIYFVVGDSSKQNSKTYIFDWSSKMLKVSPESWETKKPQLKLIEQEYFNPETDNKLGNYILSSKISSNDKASPSLSIEITKPDKTKISTQINLASRKIGPFNWYSSVFVTRQRLDNVNSDIAWIATADGLVKVNLTTGQTTSLSKPDILDNLDILNVVPVKGYLILATNSGIFIVPKNQLE